MVKNKTHNNINDNHIIIIQYSLSTVLISSVIAFAPLIIAKFANNVCIFSPLNISFITINITITEIIAITNIKILNAKWSKIEVSMKLSSSFSLSRVSCCLSKLNFLCLYLLTNSLSVLVLIIIPHQSHLTLMILAEYVPVL